MSVNTEAKVEKVIIDGVEVSLAGGECDLIDVNELPTENVDESKVYRIKGGNAVDLWLYIDETQKFNIVNAIIEQGGVAETYYINSINDVTEPKISDFVNNILYVYIVNDTYANYVFMNETTYVTVAAAFEVPDNGIVSNVSEMNSLGIYVISKIETIGIPEMTKNRDVYTYDGVNWSNLKVDKELIGKSNFLNSKLLKTVADGVLELEMQNNEIIPFESLIVPACDNSYMKDYTEVFIGGFRDITTLSKLKEIIIDTQVADSPNNAAFIWCFNLQTINFRGCTRVPKIVLDIERLPQNYKVFVPDELYDEWIVSSNAQHYVDHIYKLSDI